MGTVGLSLSQRQKEGKMVSVSNHTSIVTSFFFSVECFTSFFLSAECFTSFFLSAECLASFFLSVECFNSFFLSVECFALLPFVYTAVFLLILL